MFSAILGLATKLLSFLIVLITSWQYSITSSYIPIVLLGSFLGIFSTYDSSTAYTFFLKFLQISSKYSLALLALYLASLWVESTIKVLDNFIPLFKAISTDLEISLSIIDSSFILSFLNLVSDEASMTGSSGARPKKYLYAISVIACLTTSLSDNSYILFNIKYLNITWGL